MMMDYFANDLNNGGTIPSGSEVLFFINKARENQS